VTSSLPFFWLLFVVSWKRFVSCILSGLDLSRFASPAVGTTWPFCVDVPLNNQPTNILCTARRFKICSFRININIFLTLTWLSWIDVICEFIQVNISPISKFQFTSSLTKLPLLLCPCTSRDLVGVFWLAPSWRARVDQQWQVGCRATSVFDIYAKCVYASVGRWDWHVIWERTVLMFVRYVPLLPPFINCHNLYFYSYSYKVFPSSVYPRCNSWVLLRFALFDCCGIILWSRDEKHTVVLSCSFRSLYFLLRSVNS